MSAGADYGLVQMSQDELREIGRAIMDAMEPVEKAHTTERVAIAFVHVAGFLAGRVELGGPGRDGLDFAMHLFAHGLRYGRDTVLEEMRARESPQ